MSEACVILNDIHIDLMDYIKPAYCNAAQVSTFLHPSYKFFSSDGWFRSMWTEFEWENRVDVTTSVS
jgi:coatomer subunit beta